MSLVGCSNKQDDINISVASSLTESVTEIVNNYTKKTGEIVNINFGGSSTLKTQIKSGFDVDMYFSANFSHYNELNKEGYILEGREILQNNLCIVTNKENIKIPEDITKKGTKIILSLDDVPIGKYTNQVLKNYGDDFRNKVLENVVSKEQNVKQVLAKIALGEGDAAFVYKTDITEQIKDKVKVIEIPKRFNVNTKYYLGILNEKAKNLYNYLFTDESLDIFKKYGFKEVIS